MQTLPRTSELINSLEHLIKRIPFFTQLFNHSPAQFQQLITQAEFIEFEPETQVLRKGQPMDALYFVLKGQLQVRSRADAEPINNIYPGDMFGIIAMMNNCPCTTYIQTAPSKSKHLILKVKTALLDEGSSTSQLPTALQIEFYRYAIDNIYWLLELKKIAHPEHDLVKQQQLLRLSSIKPGVDAELEALKQQCLTIATLLLKWTQYTPAQGDNLTPVSISTD